VSTVGVVILLGLIGVAIIAALIIAGSRKMK